MREFFAGRWPAAVSAALLAILYVGLKTLAPSPTVDSASGSASGSASASGSDSVSPSASGAASTSGSGSGPTPTPTHHVFELIIGPTTPGEAAAAARHEKPMKLS